MSADTPSESKANSGPTSETNHPFAWAGLFLALFAIVGYATLRQMLLHLPASRSSIDELRTNAPALTRLIIVGATSAILNLGALVLSLLGCLMPRRRHALATFTSLLSAGMLLVLFSVVLVSLLVG
jgi:hypothetical protein